MSKPMMYTIKELDVREFRTNAEWIANAVQGNYHIDIFLNKYTLALTNIGTLSQHDSYKEALGALQADNVERMSKGLVKVECEWKLENDGDDYYYKTNCGEDFQLIDGTPEENAYHYCPKCGGSIILEDK